MKEIIERMKVISADEHTAIIEYLKEYNFNYSRRELISEEKDGFSISQCWRYYGSDDRYANIYRSIDDVHCIERVKLRTTSSGNCIFEYSEHYPEEVIKRDGIYIHPSDKNVHIFLWGGFSKYDRMNYIVNLINKTDADAGEKGIVKRFMEVNKDNFQVMQYIREKTNKLFLDESFCPGSFQERCIDILCKDDEGLFTLDAKECIKSIYETMRKDIDKDDYHIYGISGKFLNTTKIYTTTLIKKDGSMYAGHDLPVWLKDPDKAKYRVLVLSQDPRRNKDEMQDVEIGISTPFGLHSAKWRSNRNKGLVHWLFKELIEEYGEELSVYYTDLYKLRGVDVRNVQKSKLDSPNLGYYKCILMKEIELFDPNIIFLMGKKAQQSFNTIKRDIAIKNVVPVPHPNARAQKGKCKWGEYEIPDFTFKSKLDIYKTAIKEHLKSF